MNLTTGDLVRDDPATAGSWRRHRQVRGDVLAQLCAGAWPVHHRGVRVRGARVIGPVDLTDVEFRSSFWLVGCALLDGPLIATGAHLRSMSLAGTHLPAPTARPDRDGSGMAMDLDGAVIDRDLDLGDRFVADDGRMVMVAGFTSIGEVSLAGAHVGGLVTLRGASLANAGGTALDADGATVDGSAFLDEGFVAWLDTDPGYAPGKYDHLATAYARAGHERAADDVRVAKQRARRRSLGQARRSLDWLWDLTIVYGTRTGRAVMGLVLVLVAGGQAFAAAYPVRMVATVEEPPPFRPLLYSADLVVPLLDFDQRAHWAPTGGFVAQWAWMSVAAGWLLAIAIIVGLTGVLLRRD